MSGTPNWDKITSPLSSTTSEIGGAWANLISDYYNGANIGLTDPDKIPVIGTLTRFKTNKLAILDPDQSHYIIFSADDIDTGDNRQIRFRRMNSPFIEDFAVLEGMPQSLLNKTVDSDLNTITNIVDADIKSGAAIATSKLADSSNFILKTLNNSFGAHYQDFTKMTAPANPGANDIRLYVDTADTHLKIRNSAGTVVDLHTGGGGGATNLDALTDVDLTTTAPINGDVLTYTSTGTKWIPSAPPGGGGSVTASSVTTFTNKTIDADGTGNVITNIENADIKAAAAIAYSKLNLTGNIVNADINASAAIAKTKLASLDIVNADVNASAAIVTSKLADSANFLLKTLDNSFGAHYFDMTRMTAPSNPSANNGRIFIEQEDSNNDTAYMLIKKNGSFQKVFIA